MIAPIPCPWCGSRDVPADHLKRCELTSNARDENGVRPHATIGMRTPFGWQIAWADEYGNGGSTLLRDTDSAVTDVVPLDITVTSAQLGSVGLAWPEELRCPSIKNPPEGGGA